MTRLALRVKKELGAKDVILVTGKSAVSLCLLALLQGICGEYAHVSFYCRFSSGLLIKKDTEFKLYRIQIFYKENRKNVA